MHSHAVEVPDFMIFIKNKNASKRVEFILFCTPVISSIDSAPADIKKWAEAFQIENILHHILAEGIKLFGPSQQ